MNIYFNNDIKLKITKSCFYMALLTFALAFLFGFASAFKYEILSNINFVTMFLFFLLGNIMNLFCYRMTMATDLQLFVVCIILGLFWNIHFIFSKNLDINIPVAIIGLLCINISVVCSCYKIIFFNKIMKSLNLFEIFKKYYGLIIIIAIFILLSIQDFGLWFRGDSFYYYQSVVNGRDIWDFTLNDLSAFLMAGHTTYSYSFLLSIGEYIWPSSGNGIRLINILISTVTILLFYGISTNLFKSMGKTGHTLITATFAFAPLFLGITYLISSDFPLLCFFILFLFSYIKDLKILKWLSALAVCFSKEIGIIVLFGFYLGESVYCIKQNYASTKKLGIIGVLFSRKRILVYSGVLLYFVPVFFLPNGWMQELRLNLLNSAQATGKGLPNLIIKWHYYLYKAEELFIMNFMWLITLVAIIVFLKKIVQRVKKKNINNTKILKTRAIAYSYPIVFACIFFLIISMFYFTYLHYRYVQLNLLFMILLLGYCINNICISKKVFGYIITLLITILFLSESYFTIDPITYKLFINFDAGNKDLISTRRYFYGGESVGYGYLEDDGEIIAQHLLHEGADYNREILRLQYVLEDVFNRIEYNSNKLIILDNFGGWIQNDCWQLFGTDSVDVYYWDSNTKTINMNGTGELINLTVDPSLSFEKYQEVYYLDFTFNKYQSDSYLENKEILEEFSCSNGAWKIRVCKLFKK